jgi:hypothetical protein
MAIPIKYNLSCSELVDLKNHEIYSPYVEECVQKKD